MTWDVEAELTTKTIESGGAPMSPTDDAGIDWSAVNLDRLVAAPGPSRAEREAMLAASSPQSADAANQARHATLSSVETNGEDLFDPSDEWGLPR